MAQRQRWQGSRGRGGKGTNEVLVEPLGFFDLKAQAGNGLELGAREVEKKADGEVVEDIR